MTVATATVIVTVAAVVTVATVVTMAVVTALLTYTRVSLLLGSQPVAVRVAGYSSELGWQLLLGYLRLLNKTVIGLFVISQLNISPLPADRISVN